VNYSDRNEDGSPKDIPDSLIREFKSVKYGRKLYDGKGISPDIELEEEVLSNISMGLLQDYIFFDYATQFRLKNEKIAPIEEVKLSDEQLNEFKSFILSKEFSYSTKAEKMLAELKKSTESEHYYNDIENEYTSLKLKLLDVKNNDFAKHKDEIQRILTNEIILRYYHQKGQLVYSLAHDEYIEEALAVLSNKEKYDSILRGTYQSK
ncbi:MAG TPA: hypothetical protein VIY47_01320, partial [Ignavibacteriaceae bacterium]